MTGDRADPFEDDFPDLSEFGPSQAKPTAPKEAVRRASEEMNFPSRQSVTAQPEPKKQQRRRRTGRNVQLNMKVTQETMDRFTQLADAEGEVFGGLLEKMLDVYERSRKL